VWNQDIVLPGGCHGGMVDGHTHTKAVVAFVSAMLLFANVPHGLATSTGWPSSLHLWRTCRALTCLVCPPQARWMEDNVMWMLPVS